MPVPMPTSAQIRETAAAVGIALDDADVASYAALLAPYVGAYNLIDSMPDDIPVVRYPRTPGRFPEPEENPHNAWYVRTSIRGADSGPLRGKTVAVKDNIMVAGVPMMNGNSVLEGYVPEVDATVVTRLLDAGAEIVGKTHCEDFCISGGSHTNAKAPVHNPHKRGYTSGGSSSGSGAAVAAGDANLALGGDQGGSIRIPSSWCGIYGMKPTHGLVPYTGIMPIEIMVDHTGPMTGSVKDNALMLEVIAGPDGYDPRQIALPPAVAYSQNLEGGARGMRIGVVKEGFGRPESEATTDQKCRAAADLFRKLGATVEEVSIPWHLLGPAIWTPIGVEGIAQTMMLGDGYGLSRRDLFVTSLVDKLHGWQLRANEMSETTKLLTTLGVYVLKQRGPRFYGKALNLSRKLRRAYDAALATFDLLLMPTLPMKATPIPPPGAPRELVVQRALEMIGNTAPFDVSHHPAMSIPCGKVDGLPIGLMLVGKHWDEATIYRAAYAFEQAEDWTNL